mmetsp:Transcript_134317/g.189818  ORF Transcript_134317/g.189818 Transcript_134317/m.189818 type:complete len:362 (+) Transcript_134317:39-1124(+)
MRLSYEVPWTQQKNSGKTPVSLHWVVKNKAFEVECTLLDTSFDWANHTVDAELVYATQEADGHHIPVSLMREVPFSFNSDVMDDDDATCKLTVKISVLSSQHEKQKFRLRVFARDLRGKEVAATETFSDPIQVVSKLKQIERTRAQLSASRKGKKRVRGSTTSKRSQKKLRSGKVIESDYHEWCPSEEEEQYSQDMPMAVLQAIQKQQRQQMELLREMNDKLDSQPGALDFLDNSNLASGLGVPSLRSSLCNTPIKREPMDVENGNDMVAAFYNFLGSLPAENAARQAGMDKIIQGLAPARVATVSMLCDELRARLPHQPVPRLDESAFRPVSPRFAGLPVSPRFVSLSHQIHAGSFEAFP